MADATVNTISEITCSDHYDVDLFNSVFKQANDRKEIVQRNKEKVTIKAGFQKCTLQNHVGPLTGHAVHCKEEAVKGLHEQVGFVSSESGFMFGSVHALSVHLAWTTHSMIHSYFHNVYDAGQQGVI